MEYVKDRGQRVGDPFHGFIFITQSIFLATMNYRALITYYMEWHMLMNTNPFPFPFPNPLRPPPELTELTVVL